jgi:hypothetical protein
MVLLRERLRHTADLVHLLVVAVARSSSSLVEDSRSSSESRGRYSMLALLQQPMTTV